MGVQVAPDREGHGGLPGCTDWDAGGGQPAGAEGQQSSGSVQPASARGTRLPLRAAPGPSDGPGDPSGHWGWPASALPGSRPDGLPAWPALHTARARFPGPLAPTGRPTPGSVWLCHLMAVTLGFMHPHPEQEAAFPRTKAGPSPCSRAPGLSRRLCGAREGPHMPLTLVPPLFWASLSLLPPLVGRLEGRGRCGLPPRGQQGLLQAETRLIPSEKSDGGRCPVGPQGS